VRDESVSDGCKQGHRSRPRKQRVHILTLQIKLAEPFEGDGKVYLDIAPMQRLVGIILDDEEDAARDLRRLSARLAPVRGGCAGQLLEDCSGRCFTVVSLWGAAEQHERFDASATKVVSIVSSHTRRTSGAELAIERLDKLDDSDPGALV